MRVGYKLATEGFGPKELIRQAVAAEQAGFDFVEMSDHYHPWVEAQGHSAFTWSLLPAIAMKTERIGLATGVTCPSMRYHPAIIA
jgi:G6PDH family F420-dependent oxidoreductase